MGAVNRADRSRLIQASNATTPAAANEAMPSQMPAPVNARVFGSV